MLEKVVRKEDSALVRDICMDVSVCVSVAL